MTTALPLKGFRLPRTKRIVPLDWMVIKAPPAERRIQIDFFRPVEFRPRPRVRA
jgi:hypothetical protein